MNEPPNDTTTADASPQRVSTIVGDRLCTSCGYNLVGQPVLREPHYQLLIARCPECGTTAALQEYPLLGRWAARWGIVLAAMCLVVLVGLWVGSALTIFGLSIASAQEGARQVEMVVNDRFNQQMQTSPNQYSFEQWFARQDRAELRRACGGLARALGPDLVFVWIPMTIVVLVIGWMWSVITLGRGRTARFALGVSIIIGAFVLVLIPTYEWVMNDPVSRWQAGTYLMGPWLAMLTLVLATVVLTVGLCTGRMLARGLTRLLLPPRLRSSLSFLWLADGLPPPRP